MPSSIRNTRSLREPPTGGGFFAATVTLREVASSEAGSVARTCEALTQVVLTVWPSTVTVAPSTKLAPLMVSVSAGLPPIAVDGDRLPSEATGLFTLNAD